MTTTYGHDARPDDLPEPGDPRKAISDAAERRAQRMFREGYQTALADIALKLEAGGEAAVAAWLDANLDPKEA